LQRYHREDGSGTHVGDHANLNTARVNRVHDIVGAPLLHLGAGLKTHFAHDHEDVVDRHHFGGGGDVALEGAGNNE
jgi:hypothetical protein